jgi:hypothetical protein
VQATVTGKVCHSNVGDIGKKEPENPQFAKPVKMPNILILKLSGPFHK